MKMKEEEIDGWKVLIILAMVGVAYCFLVFSFLVIYLIFLIFSKFKP